MENAIGTLIALPDQGLEGKISMLCIFHKFMRRLDELQFDLLMARPGFIRFLWIYHPLAINPPLRRLFFLPSITPCQSKLEVKREGTLKAFLQPLKFHLQLYAIICLNK